MYWEKNQIKFAVSGIINDFNVPLLFSYLPGDQK